MSEWISVEDGLPKEGRKVQFYHEFWDCPISGELLNNDKELRVLESTRTTFWPIEAFTHWQPLPEPPKQEHNE